MGVQAIHEEMEHRSTAALIILITGVVFLASNLRAPITSVGPIVDAIRSSLGISNTAAGAITTVPLLAFALLSPFAPGFAKKFGMEMVLFFSMIILAIGHILRPIGGIIPLYGGTILIGVAIAVGNVLMPALIKKNFSQNLGVMTGIYSVSMNLAGAFAAGLSIPLSRATGFGWRGSLSFWAILTLAAILFWIPQIRSRHSHSVPGQHVRKGASLWRSPLAWQVTFFMGLQALLFYCLVAWLPVILQSKGMNAEMSGWMLSGIQLSQLPFTMIGPILAGRMKNQQPLVWTSVVLMIAGICGIMLGGVHFTLLSVIIIGAAGGFAFSLCMMFFSLRTRTAFEAAGLSGMAQCFGYLLAAAGPPLFGALYDWTNSWTIPLLLLIAAAIFLLIAGLGAGRDRYVSAD
ncbi:MAG TPA: MFS transporter [Bacillaceae bacterium]